MGSEAMSPKLSAVYDTVYTRLLALRLGTYQLVWGPTLGSPNGREAGNPGDLRVDVLTGALWIKQSPSQDSTGWSPINSAATDAVVSAADYGASPASSDNTEALQRWLDAAVASGPGTVAILPPGTYRTGNLVINGAQGLVVQGSGARLELVGTASPTTRIGIELRGNIDTLTIEGLWILGDGVEANRHAGIWNPSGPELVNVNIRSCVVEDVTLGISLNADTSGLVRNCRIEDNDIRNVVGLSSGFGYGIHVADNTGAQCSVLIEGNSLDQCQRHSIYLAAGRGFRCVANRIDRHRDSVSDGAARGAIVVARGGDHVVADNVITRCNNAAIFLDAGDAAGQTLSNVTVMGNVILDPVVSASLIPLIYVGEDLATPSDTIEGISIVGNTVRAQGWSQTAIRLNWGKGIIVANNTIQLLGVVANTFAIGFQARGEAAGSTTWSDRWQVAGNDIRITDGGGGASSAAFRLNPPFNTGAGALGVSCKFDGNRWALPGASAFSLSAAVSNPNLSIMNQGSPGLSFSAGVRPLGFNTYVVLVQYANGIQDLAGSGSPENVVTAPVGSTFRRSDGAAGTSFYVKESGTGNTGWVGK